MHLAQINIALLKAPLDHPSIKDFVDNLDRINALAENSPGFIWRLKGEENNATAIKVFDNDYLIINMSVWKDMESLFQYVYHSDHVEIFKRRKEWFEKIDDMHMALWYIEEGAFPTPEEGKERLEYLQQHGASDYAFTFKRK